MKILLDTHVLLWWLQDSPQLPAKARKLIANPSHIVFISSASIWELRIKESLKKIKLPEDFTEVLQQEKFERLPIAHEHAHALKDLPEIHRDPFDRLLICQAMTEGMTILTHDDVFGRYEVSVLQV